MFDLALQAVAPGADFVSEVLRLGDRGGFALFFGDECRLGVPSLFAKCLQSCEQWFTDKRIGQVDPGRIGTVREDVAWQRYVGIALRFECGQLYNRIGRQFLRRDVRIGHTVDKAGIGPVLQQAAHQIGEQVTVAADGRINAHRCLAITLDPAKRVIDILAHSVQPLEFEFCVVLCGQGFHCADCIGVMRSESRVDSIAGCQEPFRTGEVGHVGCDLAREDGKIIIAADLAQLDFGIPIGALDQPDEQLATIFARKLCHPVA